MRQANKDKINFRGAWRRRLKLLAACFVFLLVFVTECLAYFVIAREKSRVMMKKGETERIDGQLEVTYEVNLDQNIIFRRKLVDFRTGKEVKQEGTFLIVEDSVDPFTGERVIKAVGKAQFGSMELIAMGEDFVLSTRSTANYVVVSDMQIVKVEE